MVIDAQFARGRRYAGKARLIERLHLGYRVEFEDGDDVTRKVVIGESEIVEDDER